VNFIQAINIFDKGTYPIDTSKGLIQYTGNKVVAVGLLRNDTWSSIVKYENGQINGTDFNLVPGETYLVISNQEVKIPVKGYASSVTVDLESLSGWNLVPSSMLTKTSDSSKGILQNTSYSYISQMAQWQNTQSLF